MTDLDRTRTPTWLVLAPVLVTVGFYAIVLLLAVVLCLLPLFLRSSLGFSQSWLTQWSWKSFALAGALLVAAWPRRVHHWRHKHGFEIDEASQPRLFELIRKITKAGKATMPDQVYLTNDMNAAVAHVHVRFSVRQQRILILGVPLLQVLTVAELSAVLAHEFGHFAGGHTKFGAWAYRMRQSMARVAGKATALTAAMSCLFQAYARLYLRATRTLSRLQELQADAFAARIVGARHLASALRKVGPAGTALEAFMNQDYVPVLEHGRRPPFLAGFERFLAAGRQQGWLSSLDPAVGARPVDPYDSHPPLHERLAQLGEPASSQSADASGGRPLASSLISNLEEVEREVLQRHLRRGLARLEAVAWANIGREVDLPRLRASRDLLPLELLGDVTVGQLVEQTPRLHEIGSAVQRSIRSSRKNAAPDDLVAMAREVLANAVLATLADAGWEVERRIAVGLVATMDRAEVVPHEAWAKGSAAWQEVCEAHGIAGLRLVREAAAEPDLTAADEEIPREEAPPPGPRPQSSPRPQRPREHGNRRRSRSARNKVRKWDLTGWRVLGLSVAAVAGLIVIAIIGETLWPDETRLSPLAAWGRMEDSFRLAWKAGNVDAIAQQFDPSKRAEVTQNLRRALERRGWTPQPPVLSETTIRFIGPSVVYADFASSVGEIETKWTHDGTQWWLEVVQFPRH